MKTSIATQPPSARTGTANRPVLHSHHYHAALLRALYAATDIDADELLARALAAGVPALSPGPFTSEVGARLAARFRGWGMGRLEAVRMAEDGTGEVTVRDSHSVAAWTRRYPPASRPVCGIASGVLARMLGDGHGRTRAVREVDCMAMGAEHCRFEISNAPAAESEAEGPGPEHARLEEATAPPGQSARDPGPGAPFVTLPAEFYAAISHSFEAEIPRVRGPKFASLPGILLMEAAHRNGFHLFGEILAEVGEEGVSHAGVTEQERLQGLLEAMAGLGWGEWAVRSFLPGERLIVRIPDSYEGEAHLRLFGRASAPQCTVAVGAAAAMMNLLYRVPDGRLPDLTPSSYNTLFRNPHSFRASETRCVAQGDDFCELVVNPLTA